MKDFKNIYNIVSKIPQGRVMTYGQIAKIVKTNPRIVGFALHRNSDPGNIPCHRIVKSDGSLANGYAFGGFKKQKEKLENEGIEFVDNRIGLKKFMFGP